MSGTMLIGRVDEEEEGFPHWFAARFRSKAKGATSAPREVLFDWLVEALIFVTA
jgi:hypothetical protein